MELYNEDCLEKMKDLSDNSIDLLFCDLPYGQTSCKWDSLIDLNLFWKEVNRICKDTTPMFFTCSTKFGVSLINSNPKNFRYDLIWIKSAPCGFLNAKKMPMKKHEMIYVFYRKLPLYDLSSHNHKFLKEQKNPRKEKDADTLYPNRCKVATINKYDPPLPNSVIRTDEGCNSMYGKETKKVFIYDENGKLRNSETRYDPPLPVSVIKTEHETAYGNNKHFHNTEQRNGESIYDPPLPVSVIKEDVYQNNKLNDDLRKGFRNKQYDPPLPNSILEIKSEKGKHATQKPTALIEWCLKYYSKEGDTILDPTMGSGSTGVACKNMNRNFIGIEKDEKIFNDAVERLK
tara:strand:- start:944 stop:1978 length:1035 start_codon:yes stop_codon:yes gene_type:complete